MGLNAAGERVRVARALRDLPIIAEAFGKGEVSFSQVRAISRIADVQTEEDWVLYARTCTGDQLERLVRATRRATKPAEDAADPEQAA